MSQETLIHLYFNVALFFSSSSYVVFVLRFHLFFEGAMMAESTRLLSADSTILFLRAHNRMVSSRRESFLPAIPHPNALSHELFKPHISRNHILEEEPVVNWVVLFLSLCVWFSFFFSCLFLFSPIFFFVYVCTFLFVWFQQWQRKHRKYEAAIATWSKTAQTVGVHVRVSGAWTAD